MRLKKLIPFSETNTLKILNLVCFFFLVFSLFCLVVYIYDNLYLEIFTERDIRRALGWLKGDFYLPGPEMYAGSWLPGPFFYFLLFPPLLFGGNIYSKFLIWRIIWLALSYTAAFHFTSQICKHKESLFIFIMFLAACIGPSLFTPLFFASNPNFSIIFHILAVMALYTWRETGHNKYLYFLGLIIGFGVQVHGLVSVHILTALILFFMKRKKSWKTFFRFIVLIFLPCLPYLIFYNFYVFETLKSAIKQLNDFKYTVVLSDFWVSSFHAITSFKLYLAGPVFFFLLLFAYKAWIKKAQPLSSSSINLLIIVVPPVCLLCLIGGNWWYLYSIPVMLMILFTKLYDDLMPGNTDRKLSYLILYGALFILPLITNIQKVWTIKFFPEHFIIMGLFLSLIYLIISVKKTTRQRLVKISILLMISLLHLSSKDYTKNISHYFSSNRTFPTDTFKDHWLNYYIIHARYRFIKPVLQQIALDTNWPTGTAVKRVYIIGGIDREVSLWAFYSLTKEQIKKEKLQNIKLLNNSDSQIHGYFIVAHLKQFANYLQTNWKEYLSHSPYVSSFVQEEIKTGKLLLHPPKLYDKYWLIPYKLTRDSVFPEGFYNFGQSYYWEEPHWLKTCSSTGSFIHNNHDFYYCMILPGHLQRAGVHIAFSKDINTSFVEVSFFGPILGLKAEPTLADGYAYWSDMEISLFCNNQKFGYPLPNIGHNPTSHYDLIAFSKTLNSPLRLKVPVDCEKEEISGIHLRFKHWRRKRWDYSEIIPEQKNIVWNLSER